MKIILDAMGGDNAPEAVVAGALEALKAYDCQIILVGKGEAILEALKKQGVSDLHAGLEIANADDVVDMHDDPASVLHKRKNSSMVVGLKMLSDGQGDAFVSAGSTGALLTAATLVVKRVKGIRRAAMAPTLPNAEGGQFIIVDCGANAECTPEFLLQFAIVGSLQAKKNMGIANPRVGLLNIGTEDTKGTQLQLDAYKLLTSAHEQGLINFIGNVEARSVPLGGADVVVCDGYSGNILLKSIEGTAMFMAKEMKKIFYRNAITKIGGLLCKKGVSDMKKLLDPSEIGGTPFVGIKKPVIKAHGSSDARAFKNAVRQAIAAARNNPAVELEAALKQIAAASKEAKSVD